MRQQATVHKYFAFGPNCYGRGPTAEAARRNAKSNAPRGVTLRDIGAYELPPGATAVVSMLGNVMIEGGDGRLPVHVAGPATITWRDGDWSSAKGLDTDSPEA